jgi:hypothetical protein
MSFQRAKMLQDHLIQSLWVMGFFRLTYLPALSKIQRIKTPSLTYRYIPTLKSQHSSTLMQKCKNYLGENTYDSIAPRASTRGIHIGLNIISSPLSKISLEFSGDGGGLISQGLLRWG